MVLYCCVCACRVRLVKNMFAYSIVVEIAAEELDLVVGVKSIYHNGSFASFQ